jgi:hypothetical protein
MPRPLRRDYYAEINPCESHTAGIRPNFQREIPCLRRREITLKIARTEEVGFSRGGRDEDRRLLIGR